MSCLT
jgi:hypothetical protein